MKKKLIIVYLTLLAIIVSAILFLYLRAKTENIHYQKIETEVIKQIVQEAKATDSTVKIMENRYIPDFAEKNKEIDHEQLLNLNTDYKCWINIVDTEISYPVVMTVDNDYYLHRAFDSQKYSYSGTLFIDAFSENGLNQDNLIIYGHNMKDGSMFGTLKKFKDSDYFDEHPYIEIYTEDEVRVYEIFSIRQASSDINTLNFALDGFTEEEYINSAKNESIHFRNTRMDGQIITLSTCVGDYAYRLLLSGIRIQ